MKMPMDNTPEGVYCVSQVALVYTAKSCVKVEFKMGSVARLDFSQTPKNLQLDTTDTENIDHTKVVKKDLVIRGWVAR